jgi:uncharacterized protein (DUF433 family)
MTTLQGIIHGKTIELEKEPGLPDGQAVAVTIQRIDEIPTDLPRVELWMDRLVFDSAVHPLERIVKGTRLTAEALVGELALGRTDEETLQAHPELVKEDMIALRHYGRVPVGLRLSIGACVDEAEDLDKYLAWTRQHRRIRRREIDE